MNKDLIFQIIDWQEYNERTDVELEQIDSRTKKPRIIHPTRYFINLYGRTMKEEAVVLRVENFKPYFFVEIPEDWKANTIDSFVKLLNNHLSQKKINATVIQDDEYDENEGSKKQVIYKCIKKHKARGFTAGKLFPFIVFFFDDTWTFKALEKVFNEDIPCASGDPYKGKKRFQIYESNIEPYIRFNHIINTDTCGWIKVNNYETEEKEYTDIYAIADYSDLERFDTLASAKFRILSYDLECYSHDGNFPMGSNIEDPIIQIGCVFQKYGEPEAYKKVMLSLKKCDQFNDVTVISFETEVEMLLAFRDLVRTEDPDIITGYNIFGFDYDYIYEKVKLYDIESDFCQLGRYLGVEEKPSKYTTKNLSSSALGDNLLKFFDMTGRVQIDLLKVVQRDHKLDSYKLDRVAENFINQDIQKFDGDKIYIKNPKEFQVGNFIEILEDDEIEGKEHITDKIKILNINYEEKYLIINKQYDEYKDLLSLKDKSKKYKASLVKDDIGPDEIFACYRKSSYERRIVAEYCIQDCVLVLKLLNKLQVLTNNIAMANVCSVPLSYIFLRGQGVKIFSLVAKFNRKENYVMPVLKKPVANPDGEDDVGYEGAIVFEPIVGFYEESVWVNDYSSLYPSSMIATNISHETIVVDNKYKNLPDYEYRDVTFKNNDGTTTTCTYAKKIDPNYETKTFGILPQILMNLLGERKATRKLMESEKDPFVQSIMDGKQLALKVTANSLYGQMGAKTSPIFMLELAASTTAVGRKQLELGRTFVENNLTKIMTQIYDNKDKPEKLNEIFTKELKDKTGKPNMKDREWALQKTIEVMDKYTFKPETLYGDTDSVFNRPNFHDKITGLPVSGPQTIMPAIILGQLTSKLIQCRQAYPQELSYEKVFCPWIIVSKKRYIGKKYEEDDKKYKVASMGLVLKRRDNAPIVKKVVGGLLKKWMIDLDKQAGIDFIRRSIYEIIEAKYPIRYFITSKTLKGKYKGKRLDGKHPKGSGACTAATGKKCECSGPWPWKEVQCGIAHVTLCQRMAERDPGNEPATNERIPYVAVEINENEVKSKKKSQGKEDRVLQGDKIEHPDYIQKSKLQVDYKFYLTNQIMNPTCQFLEIVMKDPEDMFNEAIKNQVFTKIGMKQNNLSNYFQKKKVVYENVNVYSETKEDSDNESVQSKGSYRISK